MGLNGDGSDADFVWPEQALVTVVFDAEMKSFAAGEKFDDRAEVEPVNRHFVLGQREGEQLKRGLSFPLPAVEPRQRESDRIGVPRRQHEAAVALATGETPGLRRL